MDKQQTHQVPIDAVNPDELPRRTPIKYEDLCRIIGDLYVQMHNQDSTQQEQFKAVLSQMQERMQGHIAENERLKAELARYERDRENVSPHEGDGQ
jgi:hypothetical protein